MVTMVQARISPLYTARIVRIEQSQYIAIEVDKEIIPLGYQSIVNPMDQEI